MLLLAGCVGSGPASDACAPGPDPWLEVGSGVGGYLPVPDGGELPLVHGPQGGYHLELGLAAGDLDLSELVSGRFVGSVGGAVLADTEAWLEFACEPGALEATAWGARLVYPASPDELDGQETTVEARVRDLAGVEVSVTRTFVIRDAP